MAGGVLTFNPTPGAQKYQDADWLAIGSWAVAMDNGATVYGAFARHANPFQNTHGSDHTQIQGTATYDGQARGHYAEYDAGARESGVFAATAKFEADFGDNTADGNIYGTLRDFSTTAHGAAAAAVDRDAWKIDFASAASKYVFDFDRAANPDRLGFAPPLTGKWGGEDDDTMTGTARFKLFRDETLLGWNRPTAIAGMFAATGGTGDDNYDLSLIGAVGVKRKR